MTLNKLLATAGNGIPTLLFNSSWTNLKILRSQITYNFKCILEQSYYKYAYIMQVLIQDDARVDELSTDEGFKSQLSDLRK